MTILDISIQEVGAVGDNPRIVKLQTNDSYAAITSAGYITPFAMQSYGIMQTDLFEVNYGPGSVYTNLFQPSISNGVVTLEPLAGSGEVLLPVTSGDFAIFANSEGSIEDIGYSPSNATKTKVVMANGTVTANNIPSYSDTAGTIGAGYTPSNTAKSTVAMINAAPTSGHLAIFTDNVGTIGDGGAPTSYTDPGVVYNMQHTWTSNTVTAISAGAINVYTGTAWVPLTYATSTNLDITTSGAGGLDTGTVAASTTYYIIAAGGSGHSPILMYTANPASPTYPAGYTYSRIRAVVITDGSANINKFMCVGLSNVMNYTWDIASPYNVVNNSGASSGSVSLLAGMPPSIGNMVSQRAYLKCQLTADGGWLPASPEYLEFVSTTATEDETYIQLFTQGVNQFISGYFWITVPTQHIDWDTNSISNLGVTITVKGFEIQI